MVAAAIVANPIHAKVGATVTVTGTNFTGVGDTIAFTYAGVAPTVDNVSGQVVSVTGGFTGTFVVPETDAAANPVTLECTDAPGVDDVTTTFTADASFTMTPSHAKVGTALIAVAGHAYTNGDTMAVFTFSGVQPAVQTIAGVAAVGATGTFSGTFTVPAGSGATHPVIATDAHAVTATVNFTLDPAISFAPGSGSEDDVVTVTGSGFTNTKHITTFTVAGIAVTLTPAAPNIGATGAWTGTFPVPNESAGIKSVVATSNQPETATASFTITGGSMAPDGKNKNTAGAANNITVALTTAHDQDFVIGVVAWQDIVGTDQIGTISDVAALTWKLRGPTTVQANGLGQYFYMQKFYAYAPVTLAADTITVRFLNAAGAPQVVTDSAVHVWGSAFLNANTFDLNPSLPSDFSDSGVQTAETATISTFVAPTMIYGAILTSQTSVIVAGAGYTEIEQNTAGLFTLETEYLIVTDLKRQFPVTWTLANHNYTVIMMEVDAEAELDSSSNPWKTIDRSAYVEPVLGNVEEGVTRSGYPIISKSGQVVTYDRSEGATYTKDEDHTAANDPTTGPSSNQWG